MCILCSSTNDNIRKKMAIKQRFLFKDNIILNYGDVIVVHGYRNVINARHKRTTVLHRSYKSLLSAEDEIYNGCRTCCLDGGGGWVGGVYKSVVTKIDGWNAVS